MIRLTRLDDSQVLLNIDLITHVQIGADTVVFLSTGESYVVKETAAQVEALVVQFRQRIFGIGPQQP